MGHLDLLVMDSVYTGAINAGKEINLREASREYIFYTHVQQKLTISGSVLDLGFMNWNKKYTSIARANANQNYNLANSSEVYDFVDKVSSGEILNYDM